MILQILDHFDSQVQVMAGMRVEKFAHVLSLIRAFFYDVAVVFEQVIDEELVELLRRSLLILIYFS